MPVVYHEIPDVDLIVEHGMDDVVGETQNLALEVGTDEVVVQNDIRSTEQHFSLSELYLPVIDIELYTPCGTEGDEIHLGIEWGEVFEVTDVVNDGDIAVIVLDFGMLVKIIEVNFL
jgi:hypothetical protein